MSSGNADDSLDLGQNRKEQRRLEAQERQKLAHLKKPLQSRISKIEKEMDKLNAEKAQLDIFVADAASYEPAMKTQLTESIRRQADVNGQLETLEAQWLEAHEELEQIG